MLRKEILNGFFYSASILFNNSDYASAISLEILAIEKAGKFSIFRSIILT